MYSHHRNFKFKKKYQQYRPSFQTIFPFLMNKLLVEDIAPIEITEQAIFSLSTYRRFP